MKKATFILLFMMGILSLINAESSALMKRSWVPFSTIAATMNTGVTSPTWNNIFGF